MCCKNFSLNKVLMIFISLTSSVWFAAYVWWNHLYKWVTPLVWDLNMTSRTFMNTKHTHDLVNVTIDNNKNFGDYCEFLINNKKVPLVFLGLVQHFGNKNKFLGTIIIHISINTFISCFCHFYNRPLLYDHFFCKNCQYSMKFRHNYLLI